MNKEWLNYQNGCRRIHSSLTKSSSESWDNKGCVFYAKKGSNKAWMQPLLSGDKSFVWPNSARLVNVSTNKNPVLATCYEPMEKANSSHLFTQGLADRETTFTSIQYGEICSDCS